MVSFKFSLLTCNASSIENTIPLVYIKGIKGINTSGGQW